MRRRTDQQHSSEWIREKIKALVDVSGELTIASNIHYPGHAWSIVKLLLLSGWVSVYTTIIPKHFSKYKYIDLLAGSGTTYVEDTRDVVVGSPFIAHFLARHPFTNYVYIEERRDRYEALRQRVNKILGEKAQVLQGDCNKVAQQFLPVEETEHGLVFVDNEGFDAIWRTIEEILKSNTDTLILFPTSSVVRVMESSNRDCLDRFYGNKSWLDARNDAEEFLNLYLRQLKEEFKRFRKREGYISNVRVGSEQFYYDIILVCKMGPYVRAWDYLKERLDWQDPKMIGIALDVLKGRATQIDWFIDLQEQIQSIRHRERPKDTRRATLTNFFPKKEKGKTLSI